MVREGTHQINISITEEKYKIFEKGYKESKSPKKMPAWILDTMLMDIEKSKLLKEYAPYIEKISVEDTVVLRDSKLKRIVEVSYKKFWCDVCQEQSCPHIHFALTLPELAKLKGNGK